EAKLTSNKMATKTRNLISPAPTKKAGRGGGDGGPPTPGFGEASGNARPLPSRVEAGALPTSRGIESTNYAQAAQRFVRCREQSFQNRTAEVRNGNLRRLTPPEIAFRR